MSAPDEHLALLRAFLLDDPAAVAEVEACARAMVASRPWGLPHAVQQDLVQETLLQLLQQCAREDFELRSSLPALVRRIALARCIDWVRRQRPTTTVDPRLPDPAPLPDAILEDQERRERLARALVEARPLCRELVQLHFGQGKGYREIGEQLGRNPGTLRVHMHNCVKQLRERMLAQESAGVDG